MPDVSKVILNGTTLMDVTDKTVDEDNLLYGETAVKNDGRTITGAVVTAPASSTDPAMDGTASAGLANTYSRGDHVHPTDTSRQAKITASGILKGNGSGGVSAAVAGTDYILSESDPTVPAWAKESSKPTYTANEVGAIPSTDKGAASGVAPLNASSKIDATYLPSYVDDVIEGYYNSTDGKFYEESTYTTEITAEAGKIYIDLSTNKEYRWGGSAYVEMPKGSTVTVTPNLSSGTKVGTINIDGTNYDLYAPTDTDTKVTQTKATYSSYTYWRNVPCGAISSSTATGAFSSAATTDREYTFDNLRFQPSTGILRAKAFNPAPTVANTTASDNHMTSDSVYNIYFRVNDGEDTVMTLYSNGTDMQVRPGGQYDNKVDLGKPTVRWKDAYLSGTVNAADYAGDITATTTVASGDKIIVHDASASKVAGGITFGSSTTQYLANDGSWQTVPSGGATDFADLDDVFIATVDVTTHAQVLAAYTAGKIIFATDSSCKIFVPLVKYYSDQQGYSGTGSFYFSNIAYGMSNTGPRQTLMELDVNDTWASSDHDLATTGMIPSVSGLAPLASPAFTGTPTAPTATAGTNTTQIATTAFVKTAVDNSKPVTTSVTISVSDWDSSTLQCEKTVSGMTSIALVQVNPLPNQLDQAAAVGIYCSSQGSNYLRFKCKKIPTDSIVMNVAYWK